MGRALREEYKGAIYHVIARGNNKEFIFKDSIDKGYFIKLIKETTTGMGYHVFGYVLMDNHYHIIIQTHDKKLHEIMHQINNKYSKYFNAKYERVGHVFQGRYKALLVQDESYLIGLLRYIHQNPIKGGICKDLRVYRWSSDYYYRNNDISFVDIDTILDKLDSNRLIAVKLYAEIVMRDDEQDYEKGKAIGNATYQSMFASRRKIVGKKRLDEILIDTGINLMDFELVKSGSRKRTLTEFKLKYAREALKLNYTYKEIGVNINLSDSAIKDLIMRHKITD